MSKINKKDIVKEKVKKVSFWSLNIVCYISTFLFILFIIIGSVGVKKQSSNTHKYKNEVVEVVDTPSRAVIDGDNDTIYLNPSDENINYRWCEYLGNTDYEGQGINLELTPFYTIYCNYDSYEVDGDNNVISVSFITYNTSTNPEFSITFYNDTFEVINHDDDYNDGSNDYISISIQDDGILYLSFKNAVEAVYYADPNDDIFDNLGDSVVGFVGTINSGLTSAISIFYNDGLTTIGILSIIVVSVVLAYFSLRMIMGLIRLRG